jgi:hypothetical protein
MRLILQSAFCALVACSIAWAQNSPAVSADLATSQLKVSVDNTAAADLASCGSEGSINPLVLQFRYGGMKRLRAYLVGLSYPNPKGGLTPLHEIASDLVFPNRKLIEPGAAWRQTICTIPDGVNPADVSATVDLLGFEDGSSWGPRQLRSTSYEFLGNFEGVSFAQDQTDLAEQFAPIHLGTNAEEVPDSTATGPLKLTAIIQHNNSAEDVGNDRMVVRVTNVSGVPVRGYVFKISFFDHATGSFLKSVTTQTLEMTQDPSAYLPPGQSWGTRPRKIPLSSDGFPGTYKLTLDLVLFEGGKPYHPVTSSRKSDELIGIVQALSMINAMRRGAQLNSR